MNKSTFILAIMCVLATAGCASSTYKYTLPNNDSQVETERLIPMPFNEFWDVYVAELSKTFFVINNIAKESRIINVSFSTNTPSEYIDCGYSNRTFNHYLTGEKSFDYKFADTSHYQEEIEDTNLIRTIIRITSLNGRINIFMAPKGDQTLLRANALYNWSVNLSSRQMSAGPLVYQGKIALALSSRKSGEREYQGEKIQCRAKGTLEKSLLELVEVGN